MINDDIRFVKSYINNSSLTWKYVGKRLQTPDAANIYQITGGWGKVDSDEQNGQWAFTRIDPEPLILSTLLRVHGMCRLLFGEFCACIMNYLYRILCKVGNYCLGVDVYSKDHQMQLVMEPVPSNFTAINPPGLLTVIGSGLDNIGAFTINASVKKDGMLDVTKSYDYDPDNNWVYKGRFDGVNTIVGIWVSVSGSEAGGIFALFKKQTLDSKTAMKVMPQVRAIPSEGTEGLLKEVSSS